MAWNDEQVSQYLSRSAESVTKDEAVLYSLILDSLDDVASKRVVDYGCGEGRLVGLLREHNAFAFGCDTSLSMLLCANQTSSQSGSFFLTTSGAMPLADHSIDAIVSNLVFMMCPSVDFLEDVFSDCYRVLRSGGRLVFSVTHPAFIETEFLLYKNIFPEKLDYLKDGSAYQFVLKKDGKDITDAGFIDYHYPLQTYMNLPAQTGFVFDSMQEVRMFNNEPPSYVLFSWLKK